MMTKTDYEVTAQAVASSVPDNRVRMQVAKSLADAFEKRNPKFQRRLFLHQCKFTETD